MKESLESQIEFSPTPEYREKLFLVSNDIISRKIGKIREGEEVERRLAIEKMALSTEFIFTHLGQELPVDEIREIEDALALISTSFGGNFVSQPELYLIAGMYLNNDNPAKALFDHIAKIAAMQKGEKNPLPKTIKLQIMKVMNKIIDFVRESRVNEEAKAKLDLICKYLLIASRTVDLRWVNDPDDEPDLVNVQNFVDANRKLLTDDDKPELVTKLDAEFIEKLAQINKYANQEW